MDAIIDEMAKSKRILDNTTDEELPYLVNGLSIFR